MQNLISNALKYCCAADKDKPVVHVEGVIVPKESIKPELLNEMKHSDEYLQIKVKDTGIGFDQKHSESIFDLFTRLHGNASYEGTGIGLAICKRVAENHGGDIRAFSEEGKGTLFVVTLPYYNAVRS
jgi:signal transduction histidine kinase